MFRSVLLSVRCSVICAPGTAASLLSWIVPLIEARVDCALAVMPAPKTNRRKRNRAGAGCMVCGLRTVVDCGAVEASRSMGARYSKRRSCGGQYSLFCVPSTMLAWLELWRGSFAGRNKPQRNSTCDEKQLLCPGEAGLRRASVAGVQGTTIRADPTC